MTKLTIPEGTIQNYREWCRETGRTDVSPSTAHQRDFAHWQEYLRERERRVRVDIIISSNVSSDCTDDK